MDVGLPLKPYCPFFFKVGRIYPKIQSIITDLKFNYLTELLFFYATLVTLYISEKIKIVTIE